MGRWAGWGAGPAGAGSTGGPTRVFLVLALAGCVVVTALLASEGRPGPAVIAAGATIYFALRLFAGLGRERR